jgi:hypothetical protein
MRVQLAGSHEVDLMAVLALWHELMSAWHPEIAEPMAAPMRLHHATESLARRLGADGQTETPRNIAERACGFDVVLRLASRQINMMHADRPFFARPANARWFTRVTMPGTGFAGAQLTEAALAAWNDAGAERRDSAIEEARGLLESDIESAGVIVRLLPREDAPEPVAPRAERPRPAPVAEPGDRKWYLRALVRDIHADPFQPRYRRRIVGQPVTGWAPRLLAYFWPGPRSGYRETRDAMRALTDASGKLAQVLAERGWTEPERMQAVQLAHDDFEWGDVPQDPDTVTPSTVQAVYEAALSNDAASKANMNSGWTKVAAFATAHLEETQTGRPQAIWDSRVATAIISRLERVVPDDVAIADLFPGLGTVPGRGGTRPRPTTKKWPSGYRSWRGQVAGSEIVRDIRDILNEGNYSLPQFEGGPVRWTTRDVEMVLFMDGY